MRAGLSPRFGGVLLAVGGVGFFLAGGMHPQPRRDVDNFADAMTSMLSHPLWPLAHWVALATGLLLAWAVWVLVDAGWMDGSVVGLAGARLAILASVFMSVQWAVEIAARGALEGYSGGQPTFIVGLIDAMQAVGWPGLGIGFGLMAGGIRGATPRWVGLLGVVGAVSIGLAGPLAQGLHILEAGVLFLGGNLLSFWMVWAGVRAASGRRLLDLERVSGGPSSARVPVPGTI